MKQLSFFEPSLSSDTRSSDTKPDYWKLFVDGAARNNPGPAAAGIYMVKNETVYAKHGFYLGSKTNNQAEYLALIIGLLILKQHMQPHDLVLIVSDSQLLVRQFHGMYKVKEPHLKALHTVAQTLVASLQYTIVHIFREDNVEADEQANYAIDHKVHLSPELKKMLQQYEITI
ncbi:MAG: ribonuclease HI family protein [Candidatus Babeliales bacterium]